MGHGLEELYQRKLKWWYCLRNANKPSWQAHKDLLVVIRRMAKVNMWESGDEKVKEA